MENLHIEVTGRDAPGIGLRLIEEEESFVRLPNGVVWEVLALGRDGERVTLALEYRDPSDLPIDAAAVELPRGATREVVA
jgi:hypothetical protein